MTMSYLYQASLYIHIIAGAAALLTLIVPFVGKKEDQIDKSVGCYFVNGMLVIGYISLVVVVLIMIAPEMVLMDRPLSENTDFASLEQVVFTLGSFMFTLVALVIISVGYGIKVLKMKEQHTLTSTPL